MAAAGIGTRTCYRLFHRQVQIRSIVAVVRPTLPQIFAAHPSDDQEWPATGFFSTYFYASINKSQTLNRAGVIVLRAFFGGM